MDHQPTISADPKPDIQLRNRYGLAVKEVCDGSWIPSQYKRHVFDTEDGIRFIISNDHIKGGEEFAGVHVSASINEDSEIWREGRKICAKAQSRRECAAWFEAKCEKVFARVFGKHHVLKIMNWTVSGVPHWLCTSKEQV